MSISGLLGIAILVAIALIVVATVVATFRGGLGPADPPASHPRHDVRGFPVLAQPRGALARNRPGSRARNRPGSRHRSGFSLLRTAQARRTSRPAARDGYRVLSR